MSRKTAHLSLLKQALNMTFTEPKLEKCERVGISIFLLICSEDEILFDLECDYPCDIGHFILMLTQKSMARFPAP